MIKILHARLQHYVNQEFPDVQAGLEKEEELEIKLPTFAGIIEKAREFQKNIYLCFIDHSKVFVWIMINCGKILERQKYQTILLVFWETCMWVKNQQSEPCMEQLTGSGLRKEYDRAVFCHRLFNLYADHITRNAGLDELQAGIKIGGRNINNLR